MIQQLHYHSSALYLVVDMNKATLSTINVKSINTYIQIYQFITEHTANLSFPLIS